MTRTYVIPSLALLAILLVWDFTKPRYPANFQEVSPVSERSLPNGGVPPWNFHEDIAIGNRETLRRSTEKALDTAWSEFCTPEGRARLARSLSSYFILRQRQRTDYERRWGDEGRDYIVREWATATDKRIERLTAETFERGYIAASDFGRSAAAAIGPFLAGAKPGVSPCPL